MSDGTAHRNRPHCSKPGPPACRHDRARYRAAMGRVVDKSVGKVGGSAGDGSCMSLERLVSNKKLFCINLLCCEHDVFSKAWPVSGVRACVCISFSGLGPSPGCPSGVTWRSCGVATLAAYPRTPPRRCDTVTAAPSPGSHGANQKFAPFFWAGSGCVARGIGTGRPGAWDFGPVFRSARGQPSIRVRRCRSPDGRVPVPRPIARPRAVPG